MKVFQNAKEMYAWFDGSHFHMDREGVLDSYNSFNPTEKDEISWRKELIELYLRKLPDTKNLTSLHQLLAYEAIPELINFAEKGDGFFRCRLAETLFDIVSRCLTLSRPNLDLQLLEKAEATSVMIWESLIKAPSQDKSFVIEDSNELVDNEYIRKRAQSGLNHYHDFVKQLDKYKK